MKLYQFAGGRKIAYWIRKGNQVKFGSISIEVSEHFKKNKVARGKIMWLPLSNPKDPCLLPEADRDRNALVITEAYNIRIVKNAAIRLESYNESGEVYLVELWPPGSIEVDGYVLEWDGRHLEVY